MKVLKYLVLIYFSSLIVFISKTMDEPGCINSMTVQSVNIERDQEGVFVPSCFYGEQNSGTPVLGDKKVIKNMEASIESFERTLRNNHFFLKPHSLKIVIKNSAGLSVTAKEIDMSFEQAKDLNLFRKSLIKAWFLNFASQKIKDDKLTQEIVSDIFLYSFWNEVSWEKETNFKRWLKYVYSEKDICTTPYAPAERTSLCHLISENKTKEFDQISTWSLRPIIVNRILSYYDNMNLKSKLQFNKYWIHFASTFEGELPEKNLTFNNFSSIYNSYMTEFVGELLGIKPLSKFDENLTVDYVFEFNLPEQETKVLHQNELPFYQLKNILFKFKNNTFINLRNGSRIVSAKSLAKHWVLVQNSFPELKTVKHLPADYLTIIQAKKDYDFSHFYEKIDDISAFPWVEDFDSLTIYIPSLKLLGVLAPSEVRNTDLKSLLLSPRASKILGWSPVQVY